MEEFSCSNAKDSEIQTSLTTRISSHLSREQKFRARTRDRARVRARAGLSLKKVMRATTILTLLICPVRKTSEH